MGAEEREELIRRRLDNMRCMAETRRNEGVQALADHARNHRYIRVGGEEFRAVSLNDHTPLGRFVERKAKDLDAVKTHFSQVPPEMDWTKKEERRLQCLLIREALIRNGDLLGALRPVGLRDGGWPFEELWFALDEVEIVGEIRCDILAVGVDRNGTGIPVLIELKTSRAMKRLKEQVQDFCEVIRDYSDEFASLLEACTGKKVNASEPAVKMIIWPKPGLENNKTRASRKDLHAEGIHIIEYDKKAYEHDGPRNSADLKMVGYFCHMPCV